jgi:ribosomal protein L23
MFNLKPLRVNVINLKGKTKTNWKTRQPVVKSNRKKAIITVDKKQKIDLLTLKNK